MKKKSRKTTITLQDLLEHENYKIEALKRIVEKRLNKILEEKGYQIKDVEFKFT